MYICKYLPQYFADLDFCKKYSLVQNGGCITKVYQISVFKWGKIKIQVIHHMLFRAYWNISLHPNPLSRRPGQVKLDSDK